MENQSIKELIESTMKDVAATQLSFPKIVKTLSPRDAWAIGELSNIWLTLYKIKQQYDTEETNAL